MGKLSRWQTRCDSIRIRMLHVCMQRETVHRVGLINAQMREGTTMRMSNMLAWVTNELPCMQPSQCACPCVCVRMYEFYCMYIWASMHVHVCVCACVAKRK